MNSQRRDSGTVAHELTQPELLQVLQNEHVLPLWDRYKSLNTIEPQFYEPMIWPWATMERLIDRAAKEVSMDEAERRALLLCHPVSLSETHTRIY